MTTPRALRPLLSGSVLAVLVGAALFPGGAALGVPGFGAPGLLAQAPAPAGTGAASTRPSAARIEALELRPERTHWQETSSYAEVIRHLEVAAAAHPRMHLETFGYSNEGRALPLLVVGPESPAEATPEAVRARGSLVIYLKGNIHAGEVAGKEALLRRVRRWVEGEDEPWTRDWVLLVGPIYNADGNEAVDLRNRPRQHGPLGGMGTRANAQGLDLNRDQMKLDSPEARSFARLLTRWDPHVVVDLHTTNGTRHAYHLTYAPGLHPATPAALDRLLRDELLPDVTRAVEARHGWHFWHYGNVSNRAGVRGWWTFDHRPRFVTNYVGVRGRLAILSEAYSYLTFEDRVIATERFVDAILDWLHPRRDEVRRRVDAVATEDVETLVGRSLPLRARLPDAPPEHVILMGDVAEEVNPWSGEVILRRLDVVTPDPMPAGVAFEGVEPVVVPEAYLLPAALAPVVARLEAHGIRVERIPEPITVNGESFRITGLRRAERPFQGRTERELEGAWHPASIPLEAGAFRVPVAQPLARLVVLLLEPRADDGFANWGILDPWLVEGEPYPVTRLPASAEQAAASPWVRVGWGASAGDGDLDPELYLRVLRASFDLPAGEAERLLESGIPTEELPLALVVARESGIAAPALLAMRRRGDAWMTLVRRAGLGADRFHVEIPDAAVDARTERVHRLFRDTPRDAWGGLELSDDELVTLTHLRLFTRYFNLPAAVVLGARAASTSWVEVPARLAGNTRRLARQPWSSWIP